MLKRRSSAKWFGLYVNPNLNIHHRIKRNESEANNNSFGERARLHGWSALANSVSRSAGIDCVLTNELFLVTMYITLCVWFLFLWTKNPIY